MTTRRKVILPLVVLLFAVAAAGALMKLKPEAERQEIVATPPSVRVITVASADTVLKVTSQGTVRPLTETVLAAQVAGQVETVSDSFARGAVFRRGEVLLTLDARQARAALALAEAQVAQARVRLEREQAEAELAVVEWQDLGRGEPSALVLRQPQLAEAEAGLTAAEAAAERARLDLERTTLRAPFSGRVRRKLVDVGQFVSRGTPLAEIFATESAEVLLPIPKEDLAYLDLELGGESPRLAATLRGKLGNREVAWQAEIVRTGAEIDPQTRMLELYARFEDPLALESGSSHEPLPIGLFVAAEIEGVVAAGVVALPRTALRGPSRLLVIDDEDRLRFRDVDVLRTEDERVLVQSGLEDGERVCISPLETPVDGMLVEPVAERAGA